MNSRAKGQRGEREFAAVLRAAGYDACRNDQSRGGFNNPDLHCSALDSYHFEVKRTEKLNIHVALGQAAIDAGDRVPVVVFRRNLGKWYVAMSAEDWLELVSQAQVPIERSPEIDD